MVRNKYNVKSYLDPVQMKAVQLRMARAAVGWGVRELAEKAGVTANTVSRIELGADAKQSTIEAIQRALEEAGIVFVPENGGGVGVRVRKDAAEPASASKPVPATETATPKKTRPRRS
jgi:transcriptional regulator with XRE-family HTH domain